MISSYAVIAKILAESLLSLYPIFVKKIGLTIPIQLWARLIAYVAISALFINKTFILQSLTSYHAILLALVNLTHIYFSYMGFKYLDSGVSFAIFNTYPFMILLMSRAPWNPVYLLALFGFFIFIYDNWKSSHQNPPSTEEEKEKENMPFHQTFWFGTVMILMAAFTEALIYFLVKRVKTENHWNHLFISYFLGAVIMSLYMIYHFFIKRKSEEQTESFENEDGGDSKNRILIALGLNGILGALGYYLRFYANYRLDSQIYAILSYVGIIMAYVYGIMFNNEKLTIYKVIGTLCIIIANYLILKRS